MMRYIITRFFFLFFSLFSIITLLYFSTNYAMLRIWLRPFSFDRAMGIVIENYILFIKGLIQSWDWGYTMDQKEVWPLFIEKLPISLKLNVIAFIIYVPVGIGLGVLTAVKKNSITDYIIGVFTMVLSAIPSFIMIFALIYIFAYVVRWLPSVYPLGADNLLLSIKGLIIPIFALSIGPVANLSRVMRGELIEALTEEYVLLAKVKGLTKKQTILRHAFKNSLVPVLPQVLSAYILTLGGAFFIEIVYNIQGIANWFLESLFTPIFDTTYVNIDTSVIVLIGAFYTFMSLIAIFIMDITYVLIDPRIKIGSKK